MTNPTPLNVNAELVPQVVRLLSTRTLNHFAEEARLDVESLREAVDRYDIDYAWHVLGSQRLLDATVSELEACLGRLLVDRERGEVTGLLQATAASLAPDLLMSFDNDTPEQVAKLLSEWWGRGPAQRLVTETADA